MYIGTSPVVIAHDMVEHVNGLEAIGTIGDELMALGGIWLTRGHWGDMERGDHASLCTPVQAIAGELPDLYYRYHRGISFGVARPEVSETDLENYEETWEEITNEAIKITRGDWVDEDMWSLDTWNDFIKAGHKFFTAGADKLFVLYNGTVMQANSDFWGIHDAIAECLKHVEYEGQVFELRPNPQTGKFTTEEIFPEEEDEY